MGNDTIFLKFENPRRVRQASNFSENDPKILDLKSSSERVIFRKLSLGAPDVYRLYSKELAAKAGAFGAFCFFAFSILSTSREDLRPDR